MTFLYQKSRCLIEAFSLHLKHLLLFLPTTMYEGSFLTELNDKSKIQNQYPLLSSTKKGLFLQTDYFNKEAASSNNIGYKIVHEGDIIRLN